MGTNILDSVNRKVEIGYWIAFGFQGRGIVTAACRAVIDHAFEERGLNRVEIHCATGNGKSCAIPEAAGLSVRRRASRGATAERHLSGHQRLLDVASGVEIAARFRSVAGRGRPAARRRYADRRCATRPGCPSRTCLARLRRVLVFRALGRRENTRRRNPDSNSSSARIRRLRSPVDRCLRIPSPDRTRANVSRGFWSSMLLRISIRFTGICFESPFLRVTIPGEWRARIFSRRCVSRMDAWAIASARAARRCVRRASAARWRRASNRTNRTSEVSAMSVTGAARACGFHATLAPMPSGFISAKNRAR